MWLMQFWWFNTNINWCLLQQSHMAPAYYVAGVSLLAVAVAFIPLSWKGWTVNSESSNEKSAVLKASSL